NKVRHDCVLGSRGRLGDGRDNVFAIGREIEVDHILPGRHIEWLPLFTFFAFLFLFFALLGLLTHCIQERAFFLLQIFLTVSPALLRISAGSLTLPTGTTAAANCRRRPSATDANVCKLFERTTV